MIEPESPLGRDMVRCGRTYESVGLSMLDVMRRHFEVSHAPQAGYTEEHLNNALLLGGIFNANTAGCLDSARLARTEISKINETVAGLEVPHGEWERLALDRIPRGASVAALGEEVGRALTALRKLGACPARWDLAIDMHLIPRYDKRHGAELVRSRYKNGTCKFERYIVVQSITPGARIIIAVLPMPALEKTEDYVRMLLAACGSRGMAVGTVMADREFFTTEVLQAFEDANTRYLIPCRNTDVVTEAIGEFAEKRRGRVSELSITGHNGNSVTYMAIMAVRKKKRKKKKGSGCEARDLDSFDYDPEEPPHRQYIAFATNDPGIDVEEYAYRWGIETGFRMLESARPRTRSKNPEVRTFCFVYAAMMYNAWVVLNAMYAARGGKPAPDRAPQITQRDMTMCILFLILFARPRSGPPDRPQLHLLAA